MKFTISLNANGKWAVIEKQSGIVASHAGQALCDLSLAEALFAAEDLDAEDAIASLMRTIRQASA